MIKSYPSTFLYFSVISLSLSIILSSNNWFFTWMGLELSLFGFLPMFSTNASTTEAIMKYYLMQASGSAMFLTSFLMTSKSVYLSILGMLMKLGLFPFFQWMPIVMMSLTWTGCMILTTLQKLMPLLILMQFTNLKTMLLMSTISILISSILGYNQTLMRPLMAYSSISHTSWMVMTTFFNNKMSLLYILSYFILTLYLFTSFKKSGMEVINSLSIKSKQNLLQNMCLLILAGIPPFSIFLLKAYMLLIMMNMPLVIMILITSTYISTYYYLSFIIPNLLSSKTQNINSLVMMLLLNMSPFLILI